MYNPGYRGMEKEKSRVRVWYVAMRWYRSEIHLFPIVNIIKERLFVPEPPGIMSCALQSWRRAKITVVASSQPSIFRKTLCTSERRVNTLSILLVSFPQSSDTIPSQPENNLRVCQHAAR